MFRSFVPALAASALLWGCATGPHAGAPRPVVPVQIIAFNDFHGNLEPPQATVPAPSAVAGQTIDVPAGGAAYLASAVAALRAGNRHSALVSAGDLIGASPLVSAAFLDEPTIAAMNLLRLDFNAVGNHEFDRGRAELLRLQNGGCARNAVRAPCAVDPAFPGASFRFLSGNTFTGPGTTLFAPYAIKRFGRGRSQVRVGFIGLTLQGTASLVTPAGIAGLRFADEADSANALVPKLRAAGADAIVVLIHQGASTSVGFNDKSCDGLAGELLPILDRLDPRIDVVVSGHTHKSYVCDYGRVNPARPFLVTSAGVRGTLLTDIRLDIDPRAGRVLAKRADNIIVQSEAFSAPQGPVPTTDLYPRFRPDPQVASLVARYAAAAAPLAGRAVGRLASPALRTKNAVGEHTLGYLIADAQLAATRAPAAGGAVIALLNETGVRADLVPASDGRVTFGQLFAVQPFGNSLVVKSFSGRQVKGLLEQQFTGPGGVGKPNRLLGSQSLRYREDLSQPPGRRITAVAIDGAPLDDDAVYRIATNSFLASGGEDFTIFVHGDAPVGGPLDLDALEAYFAGRGAVEPPPLGRISSVAPLK